MTPPTFELLATSKSGFFAYLPAFQFNFDYDAGGCDGSNKLGDDYIIGQLTKNWIWMRNCWWWWRRYYADGDDDRGDGEGDNVDVIDDLLFLGG